jgi:hypothetical protein
MRRRVAAWVGIGVVLVVVGFAVAATSGSDPLAARGALDPASTAANGGRALARILSAHGVVVRPVTDVASARRDLAAAGGHATLLLPDSPTLSDHDLTRLAAAATDVVVAQPHARAARLLLDARIVGYAATSPIPPACGLPQAQRSGRIVAGTLFASPSATGCYPADGGSALLTSESHGHRITLIDGSELFDNAALADNGNAALAVNLLGQHATLVWLSPSADVSTPTSLGDVTPSWVSPVIALLLCAGLVAALWRGRRFGPLVAETLPITVRATETGEGRARLYAVSRDAAHAADRVRIGTLRRLARTLGLARGATTREIADAAAARAGMPLTAVYDTLIGPGTSGTGLSGTGPSRTGTVTDRELVELSIRLRRLESAVRASTVAPRPNPDPDRDPTLTPNPDRSNDIRKDADDDR